MRVMKLSKQNGRTVALLFAVSLALIIAAVSLPVLAQSQDPLDLYDANDNGVIDADELITAVQDYLEGHIDQDLLSRVYDLYLAENSLATGQTGESFPLTCQTYDADMNGVIVRAEVIVAISDYQNSVITRDKVIEVIRCYLVPSAATPTPTPVPSCTVDSLGTLTAPFILNRYGSWDNTCVSSELSGSYAKIYEFELGEDTHLTIDARSTTRDSYITLYKNTLVADYDNNGYPEDDKDSRIAGEFGSGTYKVEVTLTESQTTGPFSLRITGEEPIPLLGHQADFMIQYIYRTMAPTRTAVPALSPTPQYPDPGVVIPQAISIAANEWNRAVGTPFPYVLFCERTPTTLPHITPRPCITRTPTHYDDRDTTNIDVVDGSNHRRVATIFTVPNCGRGTACVKPDPIAAPWNLNPSGNGHMGALSMVIEEPAWSYHPAGFLQIFGRDVRRIWTNVFIDHDRVLPQEGTLRYLPSVLMHEFGHTAGLDDLYKYDGYAGYLMDDTHGFTAIQTPDRNYLRQVYRNEHGSEPHDK